MGKAVGSEATREGKSVKAGDKGWEGPCRSGGAELSPRAELGAYQAKLGNGRSQEKVMASLWMGMEDGWVALRGL